MVEEQSFMATIHQKTDPALLQFCLYSCFLSQVEPKRVSDALQDTRWVEAMQEELIQFKIQKNPKGSLMLCNTQAGWKLYKKSSFNSKFR
nr:putative ribonuclease H-like domain-containing protein [Tanacetum cinerariifolium]